MKLAPCFVLIFILDFLLNSSCLSYTYNDIPEVHFTLIRLDYSDLQLIGFYEFSKPFRKSLPEEFYTQSNNIYYRNEPPADFGYFEVKSILTGEQLVYISTVWPWGGRFEFPADSLFCSDYLTGFTSADPDTLIKLFTSEGNAELADSAWLKIKDTDIVNRIASLDNYEVVIIYVSAKSEWLIILYTRPVAPLDMALIDKTWPATLITRNVKTIPDIIIHNFSDTLLSIKAQLEVKQSQHLIYKSIKNIDELHSDSSLLVFFDSLFVTDVNPLTFNYKIITPAETDWHDSYTNNDTISKKIEATAQPIFRPVSSIRHPGKIPVRGIATDFNGDHKVDIIQYKPNLKFWKNVDGDYFDITDQSDFELNSGLRLAVAYDFTNDSINDILLIFFGSNPILLSGDGSDIFTDITTEAGLSDIIGYFDVAAFDFENDGDLDLIFQSYDLETVLINDGSGHFSNITQICGISDDAQTSGITAGDLNNDGYKDIILTNWESYPTVYSNNKDGTFSFIKDLRNFAYGRMSQVFDYDNDGFSDILFVLGHEDDKSLLLQNKGNFSFEGPIVLPESFHADAADINGDGMTDVILDHIFDFTLMLNRKGTFVDYTNLLINMESEISPGSLGTSPRAQYIDLDADGDLDIYSQMVVFENQGFDPSITTIKSIAPNLPVEFVLLQNYPNPFNMSTTIEFEIKKPTHVELSIYNILGQKIANLLKEKKEMGRHSIIFNPERLASGIYYYRLKSGIHSLAKKMILIK